MKLTKSQLREIIREELLDESLQAESFAKRWDKFISEMNRPSQAFNIVVSDAKKYKNLLKGELEFDYRKFTALSIKFTKSFKDLQHYMADIFQVKK